MVLGLLDIGIRLNRSVWKSEISLFLRISTSLVSLRSQIHFLCHVSWVFTARPSTCVVKRIATSTWLPCRTSGYRDQWIPGPVGCQKILRISTERLKKSQGLIYQSNPTLEPVVKWCSCQCFKPSADATAVTKTSGNRPARPHALSMRDLAQVDMAYCNA